jgi:peptide-methionine (S)-S-oxide reductase
MLARAFRCLLSLSSLVLLLMLVTPHRAAVAVEDAAAPAPAGLDVATFAAGCFWCVESDFDKVEGVVETISGYTGGHTANPTYELVGDGGTGHAEALRVTYDPAKVTYARLLDHYWRHVDFLDGTGQFCDRGDQYRPAIFTHTEEQKRLAEASKAALAKSHDFERPIAVEIVAAGDFTPAEDYHQDYYRKNPVKYRYYRTGCGRDARIARLWAHQEAEDKAGH